MKGWISLVFSCTFHDILVLPLQILACDLFVIERILSLSYNPPPKSKYYLLGVFVGFFLGGVNIFSLVLKVTELTSWHFPVYLLINSYKEYAHSQTYGVNIGISPDFDPSSSTYGNANTWFKHPLIFFLRVKSFSIPPDFNSTVHFYRVISRSHRLKQRARYAVWNLDSLLLDTYAFMCDQGKQVRERSQVGPMGRR